MRETVKTCFTTLLVCALVGPVVAHADLVVPNANVNTAATSTFLGPLANAQRTYQLLIHANQLTSVVGQELNGLAWRITNSPTTAWPVNNLTYGNYDVYLSGSVDPADRSLTFANNVVGTQTQVRSGSLFIPAESYPMGNSPNAFGPTIGFDSYLYTGGNLLVEIRHTGSDGTSRSVEAVPATGGAQFGYGTDFSAAWTGSYTGTSGTQGNFGVLQFSVVPEPVGAIVSMLGMLVLAFRRQWAG